MKAHYRIHSPFRLHLILHNLHHQSSVGLGLGLVYRVTSLENACFSLWYEGFGRSGWFLWGFRCAQGSVSQERNWDAERAGVEHALSCSRITTQIDALLCKTYSSPVLCALLDINQFWWNVLKSLLCWKYWCYLDTGVLRIMPTPFLKYDLIRLPCIRNRAINACLAPIYSVEGMHVVTVEGIGNRRFGLHRVQVCWRRRLMI